MRKQTTNEQKEAAWIEFIGRNTEPVQLELEIDGSSLTRHFNDYVNFAISLSHQEFYAMKDDNPSFPLIDHIRRAHLEYVIKENVARKEFRRRLEYIRDKFGIR